MPDSLPDPWYSSRIELARTVVREAGALALARFRDASPAVECKGVQDYVTAADRMGGRAARDGITFKQTPYALEV